LSSEHEHTVKSFQLPSDFPSHLNTLKMFDFEKLGAYTKARDFNHSAISIVRRYDVDRITENQFRRASLSIMLNIAEASGRFTKPDKRRFFVIARGSSYECVALLDYMRATGLIPEET